MATEGGTNLEGLGVAPDLAFPHIVLFGIFEALLKIGRDMLEAWVDVLLQEGVDVVEGDWPRGRFARLSGAREDERATGPELCVPL